VSKFGKSKFVCFCIVIFLFSRTDLNQLIRLPILFHHYQEHRSEKGGCSFWEFLNLHYGGPLKHADDRHGDHGKLPFKTCDAKLLLLNTTPAEQPVNTVVRLFPSIEGSDNFTFAEQTQPGVSFSVWQPPCVA
jgi:hypothetical protein